MGTRLRWMVVMAGCIKISALLLLLFVCTSYERPQFNFGSILTNGLGAAFNTALGRDCKGRPQGDYFYGCQCVGPFNIGKRKRSWLRILQTSCLSTAIKVLAETSS